MKSFLILFVLVFSHGASATIQEDFEKLKDTARNYVDTGAICEEVARLQIAKDFPEPQFDVVTGIAYGGNDGVVGELDVIVFDNNTQKAIQISEVKCWKKLDNALMKAQSQRKRFLTALTNKKIKFFKSTNKVREYTVDQFAYVTKFLSLGQQGAVAQGFDAELEYSLRELMELRDMMLACQSHGDCPKPK